MAKSKELLLIRYISFFILIFQLFVKLGNNSIISIVFLLGLIINNHLRIFYYNKEYVNIISIVVEVVTIYLAQINFGGVIAFYLVGVSIDIFTLKNKAVKDSLEILILILAISPMFSGRIEEGFTYLTIISVLFILLSYISRLYNTKLEAQSLYDKLRISEDKLIEANEELEGYINSIEEITLLKERNRISREIHDSVGHALSTAMIQLSAMEVVAEREGSALKAMANNLRMFINESFRDVKKAVNELKPDEYDRYEGVLRLQEVCKNFEKLTGVKVKVIISKGSWNLSTKQIGELYRISQEVLSNSLRHGKAENVKVIMNFTNDEFIISFSDDGIGTDIINESGLGLKNIRERAEEMQGIVDMKSSKDHGFFVKIIVPREKEV